MTTTTQVPPERVTEYAENVCHSLHLPIRGVAFIYIENTIQAALDEQAHATLAPSPLEQARDRLCAAAVEAVDKERLTRGLVAAVAAYAALLAPATPRPPSAGQPSTAAGDGLGER